jgi:hypothetical protein
VALLGRPTDVKSCGLASGDMAIEIVAFTHSGTDSNLNSMDFPFAANCFHVYLPPYSP